MTKTIICITCPYCMYKQEVDDIEIDKARLEECNDCFAMYVVTRPMGRMIGIFTVEMAFFEDRLTKKE